MSDMTQTIIQHWNQHFTAYEAKPVSVSDLEVSNDLDRLLKHIGDTCESVLEIGSGSGYGLLVCGLLGTKATRLVGFDPAEAAIAYAQKVLDLSNITHIELHQSDHTFMESVPDRSMDAVISLNVMDVVEPEVSSYLIEQTRRVLKPGGLCLLKVNFYLTDALIERIGMEHLGDNRYALNGVFRGVNRTLADWQSLYAGFRTIETFEYERIPNGPKDRGLLMIKE
jgi:SAM-dependent methyltransferase